MRRLFDRRGEVFMSSTLRLSAALGGMTGEFSPVGTLVRADSQGGDIEWPSITYGDGGGLIATIDDEIRRQQIQDEVNSSQLIVVYVMPDGRRIVEGLTASDMVFDRPTPPAQPFTMHASLQDE